MARLRKRPHVLWRVDMDYWDKLSDDERAFLSKFVDEYYNGAITRPLLHKEKKLLRRLYQERSSAETDIITASPAAVAETLSWFSRKRRYGPEDYIQTRQGEDDALAEDSCEGRGDRDD